MLIEVNEMIAKSIDTRKVRKSGNSYIVTIPPAILDKLNIKLGDELEFIEGDSGISLNKKKRSSIDDEFLSMVEDVYSEHKETFELLADR